MSQCCGNDSHFHHQYEELVKNNNNPNPDHVRIKQNCQACLERFRRESGGRPLIMAVTGRSGVGKSKFIENFCELEDCITGDGANPTTEDVQLYKSKKRDVSLQVIDTPGLGDINDKKKKISKALSQITDKKADVLFYCVSLYSCSKIDVTDVTIIEILTAAFGKDIWRHTILLLTFANIRNDSEEKYKSLVENYAAQFQRALNHANIFDISVRSIFAKEEKGIIPAIPIGDNPHRAIPLCANWSDRLLIEVIKRSDVQTAGKLLQLKGTDYNKLAEKVGSAAAGAAVGAALGAAIGAPFLGAGAPIGASVGAAVGGATGAAATSIAAKLKNKYLLWKAERQHDARK